MQDVEPRPNHENPSEKIVSDHAVKNAHLNLRQSLDWLTIKGLGIFLFGCVISASTNFAESITYSVLVALVLGIGFWLAYWKRIYRAELWVAAEVLAWLLIFLIVRFSYFSLGGDTIMEPGAALAFLVGFMRQICILGFIAAGFVLTVMNLYLLDEYE
jgi:hypothetical protein